MQLVLGVNFTQIPEMHQIMMTEEELINQIINPLGLDNHQSSQKSTLCLKTTLTKNKVGYPPYQLCKYCEHAHLPSRAYKAGHFS